MYNVYDSIKKEVYEDYSLKSDTILSYKKKEKLDKKFLEWLVGFIDGEGSFLMYKDRSYLRFKFVINLHHDDLELLYLIASKLEIGRVGIQKRSVSFYIYSLDELKYLMDILDVYPLQTKKYIDRNIFKLLLDKKLLNIDHEILLKDLEKYKIILNKTNYNLSEIDPILSKNKKLNLNLNWIIGFTEAEGTFGIKNLSPYFQIAQHKISEDVLIGIEKWLINYTNNVNIKFNLTLNKRTNVYSLVMNNMDVLWYVIIPLFLNNNMYSKKKVDFILWKKVVQIHKLGYHFMSLGKSLIVLITQNININSSTLDLNEKEKNILEIEKLFNSLLLVKPLIELNENIPHAKLIRNCTKIKTTKSIYIYKNNVLLEGSPFNSYADANEALGLNRSGRTIFINIDTNKLYKNIYLIVSNKIKE